MAKRFKREYTPVVIAVIILIVLIGALIATLLYKGEYLDETPQSDEFIQEEMVIDNKNSKCNSKELDELFKRARKVELETKMIKVFHETGVDTSDPEMGPVDIYVEVLEVTLNNVTDDIYIKVTNDANKNEQILKKKDFKDGKVKFNTEYTTKVITYTIEVHANKYDCVDEVVRKFTVQTPIFNRYSDMYVCNDYPDFYYCQEYINHDFISLSQFTKELEAYKKELAKSDKKDTNTKNNKNSSTVKNATTNVDNKIKNKEDKKNNNYIYVIIGIIVVGVVAIIATILVKKRRSR